MSRAHPLHLAVADAIATALPQAGLWLRDPACGGAQHLPLFVGAKKNRTNRLCLVDMLLIRDGQVRAIVEIEETGFIPTKVCGKYLQAALCRFLLHRNLAGGSAEFHERVAFVHVLDGTNVLRSGSQKEPQAAVLESRIQALLPRVGNITDYSLLYVRGVEDSTGLAEVVRRMVALVA